MKITLDNVIVIKYYIIFQDLVKSETISPWIYWYVKKFSIFSNLEHLLIDNEKHWTMSFTKVHK